MRSCSNNEFKSRKKPCLEYQIKKCSAPCVNLINQDNYQSLVNDAISFLSGKNHKIQDKLAVQMNDFSQNFEYEKGGNYS